MLYRDLKVMIFYFENVIYNRKQGKVEEWLISKVIIFSTVRRIQN